MKVLNSIVITVITLVSCAKNPTAIAPVATMNKQDTIKAAANDSLSYLALGDSYTIGEAVAQKNSYPYQLVSLLNSNSLKVSTPTIIATTGWTTDNLISAIANSGIGNKKFDFVTLLIGVNDQFQHLSQDNYKTKFTQVLNTAIDFAKGDTSRVFVLSIPDYGVTPFAGGNDATIGPVIDQFNAINKEISIKAGVHYLDITGISRQAATNPALIAPDGLHPSGAMYTDWIELLEPMVQARLKKN
jgi:lysophospholipase L1-like esterase